jgi:DNA-binding CsgD family transcriptional regulator
VAVLCCSWAVDQGDVVGREEELAALDRFLSGEDAGATVLLLDGESGMGKTTLWRAGVALAEERGMRVLRCSPSEAEARLSFAGLADLIDEALDEVLPLLAPPRARALEAALLRAAHSQADPHGVALGVLDALRALGAEGPLLVAVDDWQWLDGPTEAALSFAVRRLEPGSVRLLCAVRRSPGAAEPPSGALRRVEVRPLAAGAMHALLRDRLGLRLSRPALMHIHAATHGNPFFALQVGELLGDAGGELEPGRPLPVPDDARVLLRARLADLDADVRSLLRLTAVLVAPRVAMLEEAAGEPESVNRALERAVDARVVGFDGEQLRFEHPLLASTLVATTPAPELRRLHATAAAVVDQLEQRARHLALAASGPDATAAATLDAAAEQAAARGAYGSAAELCDLALQLTPASDEDDRFRRALAAADLHKRAGDGARAAAGLDELVGSLPAGHLRAGALVELAAVIGYEDDRNLQAAEEALCEAGDDRRLLASIHCLLAEIRGTRGEPGMSEHHARKAVELARQTDDHGLVAEALSVLGLVLADKGEPPQPDLLREALAAAGLAQPRQPEEPELSFGSRLVRAGDVEGAAELLAVALDKALASGDVGAECRTIAVLAELDLRRGDWESADRRSEEALALAEQIDTENMESYTLFRRALVEAHLGRIGEARSHARRGVELSQAGDRYHQALHESVLGFAALSSGEAAAAADLLVPVWDEIRSVGPHDPNFFPVRGLIAEALMGIGDLGRAEAVASELDRDAARSEHAWGLALAGRSRALIRAAEGDLAAASAECARALERHESLDIPFELARTLLVHGIVQRRAKLKRPARETLDRAAAIFGDLGAPLWLERTRTELSRIGGRRRAADGSLTATERRVAELAAAGHSNKRIASELYVSERTVEANLTRVYRKLGLHSRAELAAGWKPGDAPPPDGSGGASEVSQR